MDFDPDKEKWQCCCCRIPTGLKIMGIVEAIGAVAVLAVALKLLNGQAQQPNGGGAFFLFYLCLAAIAFLFAASSLLMVLGIRKRKHKWLYPTVAVRVLLVIFVAVFGVSTGVVQHSDTDAVNDEFSSSKPTKAPKRKVKMGGRRVVNQEEPSTALRLVFLVFLMLFVSIAVFYTIFLVVRGIHYIQGYNRLKRRRSSFMVVAQLDPNLMVKRPSQGSYNLQLQQNQMMIEQQQDQAQPQAIYTSE